MQPILQVAYRNETMLSVPQFVEVGSRNEIEFGGLLKTEAALPEIALALSWVESDLHIGDCTGKPSAWNPELTGCGGPRSQRRDVGHPAIVARG